MLGDIDWPAAGRRSFTSKIDLASKNPLAQARGRRGREEDDGWAQGRAVRLQAQGSGIRPRGIAFLSGQLTLSDPRGRSNSQGTRSSKKKNPLSTSKSRPRIIWAFPGEREPPSLGLGRQRHGGEAAPGRPPGWFLPPPGGAPGPTQARAIICPVGELMNKRLTSGEMTGGPGCSRRSRIPGHHGTPIRVREDTCSFATAAVMNRHKLGGLKQHTFILLKSRRSKSVSTR